MTTTQAANELAYREVAIASLTPHPANPRGAIAKDSIHELVESIAAQGVVTPLLVRQLGAGLQVIAGHRRLAAAKVAGLTHVPVIVRPMADAVALKVMLTENAGREDLNPLQRAQAYARYLKETGETQEQLAASLGVTQGTVSSMLALLDLPPAAHKLVAEEIVTAAHGRELGRLANHPRQLGTVIAWIKHRGGGWETPSSRTVRAWVDGQLAQLEQERKDRERAAKEKAAAAKAKADGKDQATAKPSTAAKRRTAAQALASRISRERHLEIAVRATAIAKEAVALGRKWKVPAGAVVAAAQACNVDRIPTLGWSERDLTYGTTRTLQVALVGRLPGKWRRHGSAGMPLDAHDVLDVTAAQAWLGLWTWFVTRTKGLETQLEAAAKKRLAAKARERAAK